MVLTILIFFRMEWCFGGNTNKEEGRAIKSQIPRFDMIYLSGSAKYIPIVMSLFEVFFKVAFFEFAFDFSFQG